MGQFPSVAMNHQSVEHVAKTELITRLLNETRGAGDSSQSDMCDRPCVYTHVCLRVLMCMHVCVCIHVYMRQYVCPHACVYVCACECTCVRVPVCLSMCMCIPVCAHACKYIKTWLSDMNAALCLPRIPGGSHPDTLPNKSQL